MKKQMDNDYLKDLNAANEALEEYMAASTEWSSSPTAKGYERVEALRNKWLKLVEANNAKMKVLEDFEEVPDLPREL